jgi:hypothetical protein
MHRHHLHLLLALLAAGVIWLLTACAAPSAPRGSQQAQAAQATARQEVLTTAADQSAVAAAEADANARALATEAASDPTPARIAAAADARVAAAVASAVAASRRELAEQAASAASTAAVRAAQERTAEAAAADLRAWVFLCRCVGLGGVVLGALIGGVLTSVRGPALGIPVGGLLAAAGVLATAFGATVTWLPLVALGAAVIGLGLWLWAHHGDHATTAALSRVVDAVEGHATGSVSAAKAALGATIARSGLAPRLTRLRAGWRTDQTR